MNIVDLPDELLGRVVSSPLAAAMLARACKWLWKHVTVKFTAVNPQECNRRALLTSGYHTCWPAAYGDPTRYNDDEQAEIVSGSDDDSADVSEDGQMDPLGDESYWFEFAPDYVILFEYMRCPDRVVGVHPWAIRYIDTTDVPVFKFSYIVYNPSEYDGVALQMSRDYFAVYAAEFEQGPNNDIGGVGTLI